MEEPPAPRPVATWLLALGAAAVLAALLSTWGVGWVQDDWRILDRARRLRWLLPETNHLSVPMAAVWWTCGRTGSPLPTRVAALLVHLGSYLLLVPALARALVPDLPRRVALEAGLLGLCVWVSLDPLVWVATVAYALLVPSLLGATLLHLRGLEPDRRGARAASLAVLAAGLLTWELAATAPLLLALAAWARGQAPRAALRSAVPAGAVVLLYAGVKVLAGSVTNVIGLPMESLEKWLPLLSGSAPC
jgi:hypothetical protein